MGDLRSRYPFTPQRVEYVDAAQAAFLRLADDGTAVIAWPLTSNFGTGAPGDGNPLDDHERCHGGHALLRRMGGLAWLGELPVVEGLAARRTDPTLVAFWPHIGADITLEEACDRMGDQVDDRSDDPAEVLADAFGAIATGGPTPSIVSRIGGDVDAHRAELEAFFRSLPATPYPLSAPKGGDADVRTDDSRSGSDDATGAAHPTNADVIATSMVVDDPVAYLLSFPITRGFGVITPGIEQFGRHTGIDLGMPAGSPIYAIADGIVLVDDDDPAYDPGAPATWSGISVKYRLDRDGATVIDAHMSRNVVSSGQRVRRGELLGFVGETGAATGPHLHHEIRDVTGPAVDPIPYMEALREEDDMAFTQQDSDRLKRIEELLTSPGGTSWGEEIFNALKSLANTTLPTFLRRIMKQRDPLTGESPVQDA